MKNQLLGFFIAIVIIVSAMISFAPEPAAAIGAALDDPLGVEYAGAAGLPDGDVRVMVGRVLSVFIGLLGIIFLVLTLMAGAKVMLARGNEDEYKDAMKSLRQAVIGLIIILLSYAITQFVVDSVLVATRGL